MMEIKIMPLALLSDRCHGLAPLDDSAADDRFLQAHHGLLLGTGDLKDFADRIGSVQGFDAAACNQAARD